MKNSRNLANILGFNVDSFTKEEALDFALKNGGHVITINPEMIENAAKDKDFADIISDADLVIPDGIGIEIGLRILGYKIKRIPGIEFGKLLLEKSVDEGKTVALIGAKPFVAEQAVKNLKNEIEGLQIVYSHDGYFNDEDEIIEGLAYSKPDIILVALGSPKQEFFIKKLKPKLPKSVMIGLGGSFDVWAGVVKRAPMIWRKLGLEWLYRTLKEPERFRRIFPTLPLFVVKVFKERLFK